MDSLFVASLLFFFAVVCLNPSLTTGRRTRVPKVKCFKAYKSDSNSCKKRMKGRYTFTDCCEKNGGVAYQVGKSKRGKRKCVPCTTVENWSAWGEWTKCNSPCGPGVSRRVRKCLDINDIGCPGGRSEKKKCVHPTIPNCAIHGGWSDWGNWTMCSETCGEGLQLRFRSCTNPKPQFGGRDCKGAREDKQDCMETEHCPIDGDWGEWGSWASCSVTCDIGWNYRKRKCDNPKPKYGGKPCNPEEGTGRRSCSVYKECDGESSGSGSGESSGSSGDASGSGSGSGEGSADEARDEGRDSDDDEGSAGSGEDKSENESSGNKTGSDFDFN
ncbi:Hypothetical predicted protein [Paramuricea clavata]|uniref:Uncharacterized protein n=1 Tax=Paramuricea clavata TaxID=317549 RepID=A0A6S7HVX3_PARCT|nr:Hypothetical predicted protein [Paramuricea clavata]